MSKRIVMTLPFDGKRSKAIEVHEITYVDGPREFVVTDKHNGFFPWVYACHNAAEAFTMAFERASWGIVCADQYPEEEESA